MKSNKNGWSGKEMIVLSTIVLAFLLIAIFFIVRLYNGLNNSRISDNPANNSYSYEEIEDNLLEKGLDYYNEFYENGESAKITIEKLKKHDYITNGDLKAKGEIKACDGYVLVDEIGAEAFIKCSKYQTVGFEE